MSRSARRHERTDAGLPAPSAYDALVLAAQPVLFLPLYGGSGGASDHTLQGHSGRPVNNPGRTTFLNGEGATVFDGATQYIEVADHDALSVTTTGILTIEAWLRPDVLTFAHTVSTGYVHWMGKTVAGQSEYVARMYSLTTTDTPPRPNRISGYSFNLNGGLGVGSYFQDPVTVGEWIYYVLVINTVNTSTDYATGYTKIYKNAVLRDQDALTHYNIVPGNGNAPLRIGSAELTSFFQGAVAKVALYNYELSPATIRSHYQIIVPPVNGTAAFIKHVGDLSSKTPGTTFAFTLSNKVSAGSTLIARVVHTYTSGGPSMADSRGNVYTRDRTAPNGTFIRASIFSAQINAALQPGDTILLTTSASVSAVALSVDEFSGLTFSAPLDQTNSHTASTTTPGASTSITTTQADELLIGCIGVNGPADELYTEDDILPWNSLTRAGTTGDLAVSNVTVNSAYKAVGTTGVYKYQPTLGTAENCIELLASYKAGTPVVTPPVNGTASFVQNLGAAAAQTAGTTITIPIPAGGVPAGHTIIVRAINDNSAASISASDSRGNVYNRDRTGPDGAATMRAAILSATVATALQEGDVVTVTMSASTTTRVAVADEFDGVAGPLVVDAQNGTSNVNASPAVSVTTTNADDLLVGMVGVAGPLGDGFTEDVIRQWSSLTRAGTTTAVANRTINAAYRSVGTAGTYTYGPALGVSSDWIELVAAYQAGTPVITPPPTGTAAFVASIAAGSAAVAGTTLTLNITGSGVPVGHTIIVRSISDYASPPIVTDSRGNPYTRDRTGPDSGATMRAAMYSCAVATALQPGDSIILTWATSVTGRAAAADEFSGVLVPLSVDAQNGTSGTGTAPNEYVTTANPDDLVIGLVAVAGDIADSYTDDTANLWQSLPRAGTTGLGAGNRTVNGAYRSLAAAGTYHYQPTLGTSSVWIDMLVAYRAS